MSNIKNGEKDNSISENEEESSSERNSSESKNKGKEKESSEDSVDNLDDSDSKLKMTNLNSEGTANEAVKIQTVHTIERDPDTKITVTEDLSETTMTSSRSIENIDNINTYHDPVRMSRSVPNNFLLVNPYGTIEKRLGKPLDRIDTGTQGSHRNVFHRKDYQVMLFWRGVGGGVKPGCFLNRLTNIMPGRYYPENCNTYVSYVMFLLFMMLLTTAYILNYCLTRPSARWWYYRYWWQIILSCLAGILFLNYLMFSYMMERYMALNYICLILAVVACSMFISAISARMENDCLWIANAMTAATALFLFLLSFANVDFTHKMMCLVAVLFSLFALLCIIYCNKLYEFYDTPYTNRVLYVSAFLGSFRVFLMVIELQRLLCSCVASGCCDHAFGAFILYTLYLQFVFFLFQWFPLRRNC